MRNESRDRTRNLGATDLVRVTVRVRVRCFVVSEGAVCTAALGLELGLGEKGSG